MRLEGTLYGVMIGYILLLCVRADLPQLGAILLLTFVWVLPCCYLRSDASRGYSGTVAAFSSALILLGYDEVLDGDPGDYSLYRIEYTFIGTVVLILVLLIISPSKAYHLLHQQIADSMALMSEMFENVFDRYKEMIQASTDYVIDVEDNHEVEYDEKCEELHGETEYNGTNGYYMPINSFRGRKISPHELTQWFRDRKSKVTDMLNSERILISAAVFEPVCNRAPFESGFDDDLYHNLQHSQFWMLRRICWLDQCLQSLSLYVERQHGSRWLLDQQLVNDITPFSNFLKPFEKYKNIVIAAMDFCVRQFGGNGNEKNDDSSLEFENYEEVTVALESTIEEQWQEHEQFLDEYIKSKAMNRNELMSARGALIRYALTFSVKNLALSLSEFAQCRLESRS